MAQLTVRLDDELAREVKSHADALGRSVNGWVVAVLSAAVDPEFADGVAERTRGRLARAGLLVLPARRGNHERPDPATLRAARARAGTGTPLAKIVSDGR